MSAEKIQSKAFEHAALKSEAYRITGLLVLLGAITIYTTARGLGTRLFGLLFAELLLLGVAIAYEAVMLTLVKRALAGQRSVPSAVWGLNILIETQIPTAMLFVLIVSHLVNPYLVLAAPVMLSYFFFIILSTLRLSPKLSISTGVMSALGYFAVVVYTLVNYAGQQNDLAMFPLPAYFIYAGLILASGFIAAFVAGQVRGYVVSALREAELQSELEQVKHDLEIARSIQQGLFPSDPPGLEDFDIAGWNQPADQTGGDYFDWQTLPDGRLAISLADATGHGIGPALMSASCRAYARASLLTNGNGDQVLDRLNILLSEDLPSNRFLTYALIFLDPNTSKVKVLSAGHGPILWYRCSTDNIQSLDAQGIPLGMISGIEYGQATEGLLESGDILATVTDGFCEWENPDGEQFGVKRLEDVLRESCSQSADEIIANLRSAVSQFCCGTAQMDDLTAVVVRRKARSIETVENAEETSAIAADPKAHAGAEVRPFPTDRARSHVN
jgi:serine phosphatase RsbU (regulator of sigma subunit)